jgi:hypothetical protein
MKKPGGLSGFAGQPAVTLAVVGVGLVALYQVYLNHDAWPLGLVAIAIMGWVTKAHEEVRAYRQWKQAWDGMAPEGPRSGSGGPIRARLVGGMVVVALVAIYLAANLDQPGFGFALSWLVGGGFLVLVVVLLRGLVRGLAGSHSPRKGSAVVEPVTVCVFRPLIPVPDLTSAYSALPEHCRKLLGITPH